MNVLFVANNLQDQVNLLDTVEFTVERNRTNVTCVRKHLVCLQICTLTRVHTGDKPYDCPYCVKLFKTSSDLKLHVHIHTGAKPHSCSHCLQRFTQIHHLKTHLLKSHNEGTWLTCNISQKKSATVVTLSSTYFDMKV